MGVLTPWMSKNSARAENAVEKLNNQKKLTEAALKAPLETTRAAAVKRLTNQEVIVKIAATDESIYVRMEALRVCTDDLFLAKFACAINHERLALAAVERIRSEQFLELVAQATNNRDVRIAAATRIKDETLLVCIAAEMPEYGAWKVLDRIEEFPDSAEQFRVLSSSAKDSKVRTEVKIRLAKVTNDPALMLACAREQSASAQDAMIRGIKDIAPLEKAVLEDADAAWRAQVLHSTWDRLPDAALVSFALRQENDAYMRSLAAWAVLERDFSANAEVLSSFLDRCMEGISTLDEEPRNKWLDTNAELIYLLAKHGDPRAIAPLEALAFSRGIRHFATAPRALGNIKAQTAVEALLRIMQRVHGAAAYAQEALMKLYRESEDGRVQNAIAAIPQRVYHKHTDMGEQSRSCHSDEPEVHFDLDR